MTPTLGRALRGATPVLLALWIAAGCARSAGPPEEFPPVRLGMTRDEVRDAVSGGGARVLADTPRTLRIAERDSRVAEEVFLFYDDRLAAWTLRFARPASRGSFQRLSRRFTLAFGEPLEARDDGLVLSSRWRIADQRARLLLSGYVADRSGQAPLMARVEDPSVLASLIREMRREELAGSMMRPMRVQAPGDTARGQAATPR